MDLWAEIRGEIKSKKQRAQERRIELRVWYVLGKTPTVKYIAFIAKEITKADMRP